MADLRVRIRALRGQVFVLNQLLSDVVASGDTNFKHAERHAYEFNRRATVMMAKLDAVCAARPSTPSPDAET